jgi:hypothetical protein
MKKPSSPKIETPQVVSDLYRDLRDRRLLIPVLALLIALVAVPVALSSGSDEPVHVPEVAAAETESAVEPAVLAEQSGVRNYRKRLAALKRRNPFAQKFKLPTKSSVAIEETASGDVTASSAPSSSTSSTAAGTSAATGPTTAALDPIPQSSSPPDTSTATTGQASPQPKPEPRFYAGRVDVKVGPIGDTKDLERVRYLEFLPSDESPVVAFLGLDEGGDKAIFSVSRDVTATEGEGSCAPNESDPCQFLTLKVGEERRLTYGAEGTVFRLKLLETHIVRVPDPRDE